MNQSQSVWPIIFPILFLMTMGLTMIYDTTSADILDHHMENHHNTAIIKQIAYAFFGCFFAWGAYKMGYETWFRLAPKLFWIFTFLLILPLVPGIGRTVNGSKRWIQIAGFSFQPSEFMKLIAPLYLIVRLQLQAPVQSLKEFLILSRPFIIPLVLIVIEPNNGTAAVIAASLITVSFLMKVPFRFWGLPMVVAIILGLIAALSLPYVQGRLHVYLHPESDLLGKGHQPYQAKIAAGSGGLFGVGPGESLQKLSYLPEAQNDYIAAIFAEEYGFIGIILLVSLYTWFLFAGYRALSTLSDERLLALGGVILFLIGFQAFLNLGVVSSLLPSTGLNLPFFSQGGTSLLANSTLVGLLLSLVMGMHKQPQKSAIPDF